MGTLAGPLLYCAFTRDFHIITMYIWITLRLFQAVDSHSGYGALPPQVLVLFVNSRYFQTSLGLSSTSYHFGRELSTTISII